MSAEPAAEQRSTHALANAIGGAGTNRHVDRLTDLIGTLVAHDIITVARYSTQHRPEFISHRHYSEEMVKKYLSIYYIYDPFYAYWRAERRPGIVPLRKLATEEVKRGQYIAEFLGQSVICDEVGVLVDDGDDCCLGVFLDRASGSFTASEVACLEAQFFRCWPRFRRWTSGCGPLGASRGEVLPVPGRPPSGNGSPLLPASPWPNLSVRERELVTLILAGHPSATIARRLKITVGTVKNHRRRIYAKLDITTERELFLQFFDASLKASSS